MTRWANPEPVPHSSSERSLGADLMGFGPASTPSRELLAAVLQLSIVVLLVFIIFPNRIPEVAQWLILVGAVVFFAVRAAVGVRKWRHRR